MKAHTYDIIFGRPPIGGEASLPFPPGGATVYNYNCPSRSSTTAPRRNPNLNPSANPNPKLNSSSKRQLSLYNPNFCLNTLTEL